MIPLATLCPHTERIDDMDIRAQMAGDEWACRMLAARKRAEWELGDGRWAEIIIGAFLYPEADSDALRHEMEP